jgi:diadenosine tetraphosphate (Ap4A) HIT family hydrolase
MTFVLDERLARDAFVIGDWPLNRVLLINDARWPWLILVPRWEGMVELIDLGLADQTQLMGEAGRAS